MPYSPLPDPLTTMPGRPTTVEQRNRCAGICPGCGAESDDGTPGRWRYIPLEHRTADDRPVQWCCEACEPMWSPASAMAVRQKMAEIFAELADACPKIEVPRYVSTSDPTRPPAAPVVNPDATFGPLTVASYDTRCGDPQCLAQLHPGDLIQRARIDGETVWVCVQSAKRIEERGAGHFGR